MIALNDAPSVPFAPIACIGVGNGMGKAYLTSAGETYTVWPTEGGHVDLAPANPIEFELLNFLREKHHIHHISVERVLSFSGLLSVFEFLIWKFPEQLRPETKEQYTALLSESPTYTNTSLPPSPEVPRRNSFSSLNPPSVGSCASATHFNPTPSAAIRYVVNRGKEQSDELCVQTLTLFCRILASEAGNFALNVLPFGGLYLAGGIIPEIKDVLAVHSKFLDHFQNKGRLQKILQRVPIYLVTHPDPYLLGCIFICRSLLDNKPLPATPSPAFFVSPSTPIPSSPLLTSVGGLEKRLQETLSAPPPSAQTIADSFSYPFDNSSHTVIQAPGSSFPAIPSPRTNSSRSLSFSSLRPPQSPSLPPQAAPFASSDRDARKPKKTVHKTDLNDGLQSRDGMVSKSYTKLRSVLHTPPPIDDDDDEEDGEDGEEKSNRDFIIMSTLMVSTVVLSVSLAATLGYLLAKKNH
eukprot:TRINITY_DN1232_c0_g1_i1.p1 TRINITY_DN1232_c0_g1~~TRINITY_DN1232_c0_g1_i1.p1  ORF type:complete len:466 (-),score=123.88 TRINITY_DN1232_c0_g1_i1:95-1492(-)